MAPSKSTNTGTQKRPSWLLNLNKSPQAQKLLAGTNAVNSPLLILPPEIRDRIYNYAFGGFVVRVHASRRFVVTTYQSSPACGRQSLQILARKPSSIAPVSGLRDLCMKSRHCQIHTRCSIPVHMLRVCRQIYHEAALKPFTQATFHFSIESWADNQYLKGFVDQLVPLQARSIARLCFLCPKESSILQNIWSQNGVATPQLKGLKHIEIHIRTRHSRTSVFTPLMQLLRYDRRRGLERLKKLGLKSIRFTVSIEGVAPSDRDKASMIEWIQRAEDEVLPKQQPLSTTN